MFHTSEVISRRVQAQDFLGVTLNKKGSDMKHKMTKKAKEYFRKYDVALRTEVSYVRHAIRRTLTPVEPLTFAFYELAIKANYLHWATADQAWVPEGFINHCLGVLNQDGIRPPVVSGDTWKHRDAYHEAMQAVADAGLYYELLD